MRKIKYKYITNFDEATVSKDVIESVKSTIYGVDIETTGLNPFKDKIVLVQIAVENSFVFIFDIVRIGQNVVEILKELLLGEEIKIFHNAKFDLKFLAMMGINIKDNVFDTMLAEQIIMSGSVYRGFKLDEISEKYSDITINKSLQSSNWSGRLTKNQLIYASKDAKVLIDIYYKQKQKLKELNLLETANLENKVLIPTYRMEINGFYIDKKALRDLIVDIKEDNAILGNSLKGYFPEIENFNSPTQVKKALINQGINVNSTEKSELIKFRDDYKSVDTLIKYKKTVKRISLMEGLIKEINPNTGRIHANYKQCSTKTGRYSCTEPNLQGIPNTDEFRKCFSAEEGNQLIIADYSQIELRIIAEIANDKLMIDAFKNNEDIHQRTASIINKIPLKDVTSEQRQSAKAMNFGLIYGMGYRTFTQYAKTNYGIKLTESETKIAVDSFFRTYKSIGYRLNLLNSLFTKEERTLGNRRRLWDSKPIITERANAAIQGTGADILKQAIVSINNHLLSDEIKLVGTVHDEIILECPLDKAESTSKQLKALMEEAGSKYLKIVPVVADVSIGNDWSDK